MTTIHQLTTNALRLLNVIGTNEDATAQDQSNAIEALDALIQSKSADLLNIHTFVPQRFELTPNKNAYTLGPALGEDGLPTGADWVTERPMRIEEAKLMLFTATEPAPLVVTPTAAVTVTPDLGNVQLHVSASVTCSNTPQSYSWDFGDGFTSSLAAPTHTYLTPGNYSVSCVVGTEFGDAISSAPVFVSASPDVTFELRTSQASMQYWAEYAAFMDAFLLTYSELGGAFDTTQVATNTSFVDSLNVYFNPQDMQAAIGNTAVPAANNAYIAEVVVKKPQTGLFFVGCAPTTGGINVDSPYINDYSTWWRSDGTTRDYNLTPTTGAPTFDNGDVLGVIINGNGGMYFMKNGTSGFSPSATSPERTVGAKIMVGTHPAPIVPHYDHWLEVSFRNGFEGQVGVTGFIDATTPIDVGALIPQTTPINGMTANPYLISNGTDAHGTWLGVGNTAGPLPPLAEPRAVYDYVQTTNPGDFTTYEPHYLFSGLPGDHLWVTDYFAIDSPGGLWVATVVVGPTPTDGEQYYVAGDHDGITVDSTYINVNRQPNIGVR